jgi:nitroreductase
VSDLFELDPYEAIKQPVPADGDERLKALLAWALLSPSPHNTQPWAWSVQDGVVELRGDYTRLLAVSDPDGRELLIGCGCALEHFLLRLGLEGIRCGVELLPDAKEPHLLARVTTGTGEVPSPRADLVAVMPLRRTNRMAYHGRPMPDALRASLDAACAAFGVTTTWVRAADQRASLVNLIMAADREQMASPEFRRELAHWMRPEHSRKEDGMEADLLGQKGIAAYIAPLVVRTFDVGKMQAAKDAQLTEGSPDLVVLSTSEDDSAARLATGRALAHLTLLAMAADRYSAYMNQPCEVPSMRGAVASLLELAGHPQLVIRLGEAEPVHAALRMPVGRVLAG